MSTSSSSSVVVEPVLKDLEYPQEPIVPEIKISEDDEKMCKICMSVPGEPLNYQFQRECNCIHPICRECQNGCQRCPFCNLPAPRPPEVYQQNEDQIRTAIMIFVLRGLSMIFSFTMICLFAVDDTEIEDNFLPYLFASPIHALTYILSIPFRQNRWTRGCRELVDRILIICTCSAIFLPKPILCPILFSFDCFHCIFILSQYKLTREIID